MSWNNNICTIPPTISETPIDERFIQQQQQNDDDDDEAEENNDSSMEASTIRALQDSKMEPLMISMLDQRDRQQEQLIRMQRRVEEAEEKCREADRERDALRRQIHLQTQDMPLEIQSLSHDLAQCREQLFEKEEEIVEMKAERNNTRLLLEHLECLVSKHEKSLRMTVLKRHSQANRDSSVSSEVEVLKALKSLFEHHKTLEEKVRDRMKAALERVHNLEILLSAQTEDNSALQTRLTHALSETENLRQQQQQSPQQQQRLQNGDPGAWHQHQTNQRTEHEECRGGNGTFERGKGGAILPRRKCTGLEQQLQELQAQRDEQDTRVSVLEGRMMVSQRETACTRDLNDKLVVQISNKDAAIRIREEKVQQLHERLELAEGQLAQSLKKAESLPSVEAELLQRMEALSAAEQKQLSAEERVQRIETLLEEKSAELERTLQRERINEGHNNRLSATVDKLLSESNERLQIHLKERMQAQVEKNKLMQQLDQAKKLFDQTERFKERLLRENDDLRKEMEMLRNLLYSARTAQFYSRLNGGGGSCAVCSAILPHQQPPVSTAVGQPIYQPPYGQQLTHHPGQQNVVMDSDAVAAGQMAIKRRLQKGRAAALQDDPGRVQTLGEQEWDRIQQANVLANIQQAFSASSSMLNVNAPPPPLDQTTADPQTLAYFIQDRLDAINNEIQMIQEQKHQAERVVTEQTAFVVGQEWPPMNAADIVEYRGAGAGGVYDYNTGNNNNRCSPRQQQHQQQEQQYSLISKYSNISQEPTTSYATVPFPNGMDRTTIYSNEFSQPATMTSDGSSVYSPIRDFRQQTERQNSPPTANFDPTVGGRIMPIGSGKQLKKRSTSTSSGLKSLGRIFGGSQKKRLALEQRQFAAGENINAIGRMPNDGAKTSQSMHRLTSLSDYDKRKRKKHELLEEAMKARTPFALWNGPTVVAWLELWVGMPSWYTEACRANVKSGSIMSALSDQEIQREIGVSNPLHRLKLRLAIQEMVALTSPSSPQSPRFGMAFGEMNHEWIGNDWLPSLGLGKYRTEFMECLVDARMLEHLSKRDLSKMKMVDSFHRTSLHYGIVCLKKLNYDRKQLDERRGASENVNRDLMVWSNERVIKWLEETGLGAFVINAIDSGVHGALMALDATFDVPALAHILQIPEGESARRTLEAEFQKLIANYRGRGGDEDAYEKRSAEKQQHKPRSHK
uniref:SAM domain-containing protein n=1 Tax=Globodera rostochiensis TaxID=31243 RepID=A0A914H3M0_GLORO